MVLPKSKNAIGLGNSLMNDRFGKGKGNDRKKASGIQRTDMSGQTYVTNNKKEAAWVKMRSVTEQPALDEFLTTAELAGTDFTAEKISHVKIIHVDQKNPFLLSVAEERSTIKKQMSQRSRLTVPRRPAWDENTTAEALDEKERASFLDWRRGLAELQEVDDLLMTPFERNIEVWKQLWRVIERSDLVVQIVDARNPLMFRSEDLERYVKEVDARKKNLLLINKADMMTPAQRQAWADHLDEAKINFKFFSAFLAKEKNEADLSDEYSDESDEDESDEDEEGDDESDESLSGDDEEAVDGNVSKGIAKLKVNDPRATGTQEIEDDSDPRIRILTVDELEELFLENAPEVGEGSDSKKRKTVIGLVGYPNVGKSSTINALAGAKKVSVSSTPGKTKHFQTIHLSPEVILCDCPGLVFPNFATTKAELVCNGILPIDQMRESVGPAGLIAQRIPKAYFEALYGVKVIIRPLEEGGTGIPTAEEILCAYALARGFATTGLGQPDQSRAARIILKDYVNGKLLFCHPPPSEPPIDPVSFNRDLYDLSHLPEKRRTVAILEPNPDPAIDATNVESTTDTEADIPLVQPVIPTGEKSARLDKRFFDGRTSGAGHLKMPFNYQYSAQGSKQLTGRKAKMMTALEHGLDPKDARLASTRKRHFKADKRKKATSVQEY